MSPLRAFAAFALVALATAKRNDQTFTFRFGATRVSVVQDGLLKFPANPFLAPDALVRRSFDFFNPGVDPAFFTQNVALLRRGPHVILVDTGSGPSPTFFGTAGKLIANLATLGVEPKHVTHVLLTHGHFDHVGGLVDAAGKAAFPNAKITISRREVEYWSQPLEAIVASTPLLPPPFTAGMVQTFAAALAAYKDRTTLIGDSATVLPGIEMLHAPGHTPGQMAVRIKHGKKSFVIVGDAFHTRSTNIQNPDWGINTDVDAAEAIVTRTKLMDSLAASKNLVLTFHAPFPGVGYIRRKGPFFDFKCFPSKQCRRRRRFWRR